MPLRVGDRSIPSDKAKEFVTDYVTAGTYAYPSYDGYETNGHQDRLCDGDLLAPQLLNVQVRIASFCEMKEHRAEIEHALAKVPLVEDIVDADDVDLQRVGAAFSILDSDHRPYGVRGTTLAKILHRKRPHMIPLYDQFVRQVYVGVGRPVANVSARSWQQFFTELATAMQADLRSETRQWDGLAALAPESGPSLSRLRVLDILAWRAGRDGIGLSSI